jgi:hemolysin III
MDARLYDRDRNLHYTAPTLRGWTHLLFFKVSLVVGTMLIATAHGATETFAAALYAATLSGLFGVSALTTAAGGGRWPGGCCSARTR